MLGTMSHTKRAVLVLLIYVALVTFGGWTMVTMAASAQPTPDAGGESAETEEAPVVILPEPVTKPLIVLGHGESAPFSGLLLTDLRYAELKDAELRVDNAEFLAKTEAKTRKDLELVLNSCLELETEGDSWYTSFWAGAVAGVGLAILVGWLGVEAEWW